MRSLACRKGLTILHLAMTAPEPPLQAGIFIAQQEPSLTGSAPGGRFYAPGSPAVGERKSTPKRFCDGTLPQRLNPSQCHFSQKTRPACHVQLRPDVSVAVFYAPGFPLLSKSKSAMPQRFCSGTLPSATIRRGRLLQKATPKPCSATTRVTVAVFYAPGLPLAIRERKINTQSASAHGLRLQRYNPPRHVSPENRPGMPCAVMTRCIR